MTRFMICEMNAPSSPAYATSRSVFPLLARPVGDQGKWATGMMKKLLLLSARPARALYHEANAARRPKRPPAIWRLWWGLPELSW